MLECFMLLRVGGAVWAPLIAIPAVIAGWVAAILLAVSGVKGLINPGRRRKPRLSQWQSKAVVQWISKRPPLRDARQH